MIRKSVQRFSEKIMRKQQARGCVAGESSRLIPDLLEHLVNVGKQ